MRLALAFALAGCSILPKNNPYPDYVISPGVKLAYTFGPRGGWTWGGELTVPIKHGDDLHAIVAIGPALNLAWTSRGVFYLRAGAEAVSWFAGFEGGIVWVSDRGRDRVGFGLSPWVSAIWVVGEYTRTWVKGMDDLDELGLYGKLPICIPCAGASHHGHVWDLSDHDF